MQNTLKTISCVVAIITSIAVLVQSALVACSSEQQADWAAALPGVIANPNVIQCFTDANINILSPSDNLTDAQIAKIATSTACANSVTFAATLLVNLPNCTIGGVDYKAEFASIQLAMQTQNSSKNSSATPAPSSTPKSIANTYSVGSLISVVVVLASGIAIL